MRDFQSCFAENAVQISDSSSSSGNKTAQNLVACVYHCRLRGGSCLITISWSKNLMGQGLSVVVDDSNSKFLCKADIKCLFPKRRGNKTIQVDDTTNIHIYWDLSSAKFGSGPEPLEGFYLAIVFDTQMLLLLGDMNKEALRKTSSTQVPNRAVLASKREHLYGKKVFFTKAKFCDNGQVHDLMVECNTFSSAGDPSLIIRVDRKNVMQVKRLKWKFRGNHTILVDGIPVEVFWDVHNWLFSTSCVGSAVFMFKTCLSGDKLCGSQSLAHPNMLRLESHNLGFSLILYAWKQKIR